MREKNLISNTAISVFVNVLNLIFSVINTLIIPERIGVFGYGNYQYFIMLTSFSWLFQFGVVWGFYLKYGGKQYKDLDLKLFSAQFKVYAAFEAILSLIFFIVFVVSVKDEDRAFILYSFVAYTLVIIIKLYFQYILTLSNQIKKYSLLLLFERVTAFFIVIALLLLSVHDYRFFVLSEIAANLLFLIVYLFEFKTVVFGKSYSLKKGFDETVSNFKIGINLTIVDAVTIFIVAFCRIIIDKRWNVETFAQISIAVAISNFVTTIVNAISTSLFPYLKTQTGEGQKDSYKYIRAGIDVLCVSAMFLYYLIMLIVPRFLPNYAEGLSYLVWFIPVCFFNTKSLLLCGTYFKALRLERKYLQAEITALFAYMAMAVLSAYCFNNLNMVIVSLLIVVIFKTETEDIVLSRFFNTEYKTGIIKEIVVVISFVIVFSCSVNLYSELLFASLSMLVFYKEYKQLFAKLIRAVDKS